MADWNDLKSALKDPQFHDLSLEEKRGVFKKSPYSVGVSDDDIDFVLGKAFDKYYIPKEKRYNKLEIKHSPLGVPITTKKELPKTLGELYEDPEFHKQSVDEKILQSRQVDKRFSSLKPPEQIKALEKSWNKYAKLPSSQAGDYVKTESVAAPKGMIKQGTIDLSKQPSIPNPDGGESTVDSISIGVNGREILIPKVTPDGRFLSDEDAKEEYYKTGRHLGVFDTPEDATWYARRLHQDYERGAIPGHPSTLPPPPSDSTILSELGRGFKQGTKSSLESVGGIFQFAGHSASIETIEDWGKDINEWVNKHIDDVPTPEDIAGDLLDKPWLLSSPRWWSRAAGNVVPSLAIFATIGAGATAIATALAPAEATAGTIMAIAAGITTVANSVQIAGSQYVDEIKSGRSEDSAAKSAALAAGADLPWTFLTSKFGVFGKKSSSMIQSAVKNILAEGTQESGEQFIQNAANRVTGGNRSLLAGVPESFIQGGLIGAPMGAAINLVRPHGTPTSESFKTIESQIKAARNGTRPLMILQGQDYFNGKVKGLEYFRYTLPGTDDTGNPIDIPTHFYYNPDKTNPEDIKSAVDTRNLKKFGFVDIKSKETTQAVSMVDGKGNEVLSAVVKPENVEEQKRILKEQFPVTDPDHKDNIIISGPAEAIIPAITAQRTDGTIQNISSVKKELDDILSGISKAPEGVVVERNTTLGERVLEAAKQQVDSEFESLKTLGKGVTDNLYDGLFQSLKEGKDTLHGVKDPVLQKAKPAFDQGLIESPSDLKDFVEETGAFANINQEDSLEKPIPEKKSLSAPPVGELIKPPVEVTRENATQPKTDADVLNELKAENERLKREQGEKDKTKKEKKKEPKTWMDILPTTVEEAEAKKLPEQIGIVSAAMVDGFKVYENNIDGEKFRIIEHPSGTKLIQGLDSNGNIYYEIEGSIGSVRNLLIINKDGSFSFNGPRIRNMFSRADIGIQLNQEAKGELTAPPPRPVLPAIDIKPESEVEDIQEGPAPKENNKYKKELNKLWDVIFSDWPERLAEIKRAKKFRIEDNTIQAGSTFKIPSTYSDGTYRYTVMKDPQGNLTQGSSGSYDTVLNDGTAAEKTGVMPPGYTIYVIDFTGDIRWVRIYRSEGESTIERVAPLSLPAPPAIDIKPVSEVENMQEGPAPEEAKLKEKDDKFWDKVFQEENERKKAVKFHIEEGNKSKSILTEIDKPEVPTSEEAKLREEYEKLLKEREELLKQKQAVEELPAAANQKEDAVESTRLLESMPEGVILKDEKGIEYIRRAGGWKKKDKNGQERGRLIKTETIVEKVKFAQEDWDNYLSIARTIAAPKATMTPRGKKKGLGIPPPLTENSSAVPTSVVDEFLANRDLRESKEKEGKNEGEMGAPRVVGGEMTATIEDESPSQFDVLLKKEEEDQELKDQRERILEQSKSLDPEYSGPSTELSNQYIPVSPDSTTITEKPKKIKVLKKKNKILPIPPPPVAETVIASNEVELRKSEVQGTLIPPLPPVEHVNTNEDYNSAKENLSVAMEQLYDIEAEMSRRLAGDIKQGKYYKHSEDELDAIKGRLRKVIIKLGNIVDNYEETHGLSSEKQTKSKGEETINKPKIEDQPMGTPVVGDERRVVVGQLAEIPLGETETVLDKQISNSHVVGELSSGQQMSSGIFNIGDSSYQVYFVHNKDNPNGTKSIRYIYKLDKNSIDQKLQSPPDSETLKAEVDDKIIASIDEEIDELVNKYVSSETIEDKKSLFDKIEQEGRESGFGDEFKIENLILALEEHAEIKGTSEQLHAELNEILGPVESIESIQDQIVEDMNAEGISPNEPQYTFSLPVVRKRMQSIGGRKISPVDSDTGKPVGLRAIVIKLSRALDVPVRFKITAKDVPAGRRPSEIFRPQAETIQIDPERVKRRKMNEVDVMSHAVGHYLDLIFFRDGKAVNVNNLPSFGATFDSEVNQLGAKALKDSNIDVSKASRELIRNEGIAEFFRRYISEDRGVLYGEAPGFYNLVQDTLGKYTIVEEIIEEASGDIHRYMNSNEEQQMDSYIYTDADVKKMMRSRKDRIKHAFFNMRRLFEDRQQAIHNTLKRMIKLDPSMKSALDHLRNLFFNEKGKVEEQTLFSLTDSFVDLDGNIDLNIKSLADIFAMVDDRKGFRNYLAAVNARDIERPILGPDGKTIIKQKDSGIPRNVYMKVIRDGQTKFQQAAEELGKFANAHLKLLVDSGSISQESYDKIVDSRLTYTPMWRVTELMDKHQEAKGSGKGFTNLPVGPRFTKGGAGPYYDPIESFLKNIVIYRAVARKISLADKFFTAADNMQGGGRIAEEQKLPIKVTKLPDAEVVAKLQSYDVDTDALKEQIKLDMNLKDGAVVDFGINIYKTLANGNPSDQTVVHRREGRPIIYKLDDTDLYNAVTMGDNRLGAFGNNIIGKIFIEQAKFLRAGAILDPRFSIRNVLRDPFTAFIYSNYGYNPIDFSSGLVKSIMGKNGEREFHRHAAGFADQMSQDMGSLDKTIKYIFDQNKNIKEKYLDKWNAAKTPAEYSKLAWEISGGATLAGLQKIGKFFEESTRIGLYNKTLDVLTGGKPETATKEQIEVAIREAKDTTLPYHRSGTIGSIMNRYIPFTNANLQDVSKFCRAHTWENISNPSFRKNVVMKAIAYHLPMALLTWYLGKDDEKILNLPAWRQAGFWNVNLKPILGKDWIFSLPKTFLLGQIYGSSIEAAMRWMYNKDPNAIDKWASGAMQQLLPNVIPVGPLPLAENYVNYQVFRKSEIENQSLEQLQPEYRSNANTSAVAQTLAHATQWTGKFANSPVKIDNIIRGWSGSLGVLTTDMIGIGIDSLTPKETKVAKTFPEYFPVSALFTNPYTPSDNMRRFYDASKIADARLKTYKKLGSIYEPEERNKFLKENADALRWYSTDTATGETGAMTEIIKAKKELSTISRNMVLVKKNRRMTPEQKRDALLKMSNERDKKAKQFFQTLFTDKDKREVF